MLTRAREQGDTMIEVLLAVTIFSFVAVGGLTIMNQGAAAAQRSLEISLVRSQIDAQAETLRTMYDAMIQERTTSGTGEAIDRWEEVRSHRKSAATQFPDDMIADGGGGSTICKHPADDINNSFVVDAVRGRSVDLTSANSSAAEVFSRTIYLAGDPGFGGSGSLWRAEGIWIEATGTTTAQLRAGSGYIDFHIRACWSTVGQDQPVTLGTIVRLYEPQR